MSFYITDSCIGVKDTACVDVCPVDCIHPRMDEPEFAEAPMLFIHPDECIDCGACVPACPVGAIFPGDEIPAGQELIVQANVTFYKNKEQAYALVKLHQAPKLATD